MKIPKTRYLLTFKKFLKNQKGLCLNLYQKSIPWGRNSFYEARFSGLFLLKLIGISFQRSQV